MTDLAYSSHHPMRRMMRALATRVSNTAARWEAQVVITSFGRVLQGRASRRLLELRLSDADQTTCTEGLVELLPRRIGAAQLALVPVDHADAGDLRDFVEITADVATEAIVNAETGQDVLDAIGDALDSLHSF